MLKRLTKKASNVIQEIRNYLQVAIKKHIS
jgi:hypothetical protein